MHPQRLILLAALVFAAAYWWLLGGFVGLTDMVRTPEPVSTVSAAEIEEKGLQVATFAGGCFWSTQAAFDGVRGVMSTTVGYTGGRVPNPTYKQVTAGTTGHAEAVQIVFDTSIVSYDELLERYWRSVDPFVSHRQFCDFGDQYRPEVFFHSETQRAAAEASRERVSRLFDRPVLVEIEAAAPFYRAEESHQAYYRKNATQYAFYKYACGRERRIKEIWGDEMQN